MKIACFGDRHVSARSPRYRHALEVWDFAIGDAIAQGATVFVGLGDVCEGDPNGEERYELGLRYVRMLKYGPVFEALGNHESRESLRWLEFLGVQVAWDEFISATLGGATLLVAPYARKGHAPYQALAGTTIEDTARSAAERIAEAVHAVGNASPLIVAGHWAVESMRVGDSEYEIHIANEMVVPIAALAPATLVVTGHIHKAQEVAPNVVCAGSLYRTSFSEANDPKSYTLVSIDAGRVSWERRTVPARDMKPYHMAWDPGQQVRPFEPEDVAGKEVKITVEIPEDQLATFDASFFDAIKAAASHFILEKVTVAKDRTRSAAIAKAETLEEQLVAWLAATYPDIATEHHHVRLCLKLAEVAA